MSRLTARVVLFSLSLAALSRLPAQEPAAAPAAPALTLEECITRVLQKNFNLRIQGFNSDNAKESLIIAKAGFDPTFTATGTRSYKIGRAHV
jgi:outer membrane protein TolC